MAPDDLAPFAPLASVWTPHPGQAAFLASPARFRTLACGRRWGKTDACAADLVLAMLRARAPERALVVAPTLDQARLVFERTGELIEALAGAGAWPLEAPRPRASPHPRLLVGPHSVGARSAHRPRSLRGYEATHIVVDEAAYVAEATIRDVLSPMLATTDGRLTLVSTPHGRGGFFDAFRRGQEGRGDHWSLRSPSAANPRVSPRFLASQRELLPAESFEVEYEAAFHDVAGTVFASADIDAALGLVPNVPPSAAVVVGVDWGRTGDATAFVALAGASSGARVAGIERHAGMGWIAQRERLAGFLRAFPGARVVCDATGLGGSVTEFLGDAASPLRLPGVPLRGVVFTSRAKEEMVLRLRLLLERRLLALLPDRELVRELHDYAAAPTPSGGLRYAASHGHDDLVSALLLAASELPPAYAAPPILVGSDRHFRNEPL